MYNGRNAFVGERKKSIKTFSASFFQNMMFMNEKAILIDSLIETSENPFLHHYFFFLHTAHRLTAEIK